MYFRGLPDFGTDGVYPLVRLEVDADGMYLIGIGVGEGQFTPRQLTDQVIFQIDIRAEYGQLTKPIIGTYFKLDHHDGAVGRFGQTGRVSHN